MKKEAKTTTKQKSAVKKKSATKSATENVSAKDRIKPRGAFGILKGKFHYDESADILTWDYEEILIGYSYPDLVINSAVDSQ